MTFIHFSGEYIDRYKTNTEALVPDKVAAWDWIVFAVLASIATWFFRVKFEKQKWKSSKYALNNQIDQLISNGTNKGEKKNVNMFPITRI